MRRTINADNHPELFFKMESIILKFWPVILALISVIAWLIRLESRVKEHTQSICRIEGSQEKNIDKLTDKLDRVDEKLSTLGERISELTGYFKRYEEEK